MIYYRVAIHGSQSAMWRWKSSPLTSLDGVLGWLQLYRCMPRKDIRVFLSSSPGPMEDMLSLANQGLLSTAITVDQLWNKHCINWTQVRRLEIELGAGGDHDCPYTWSLPPEIPHVLAWTELLSRRARGEVES